ncbi:MAG: hypothetical protein Q8T11_11170 [Elusimicrobiota bacterium]|nr:hypothetical protein [Elusimicrobiota bacterium]
MKNKRTTSRLKIALAVTALYASSWAAADNGSQAALGDAFGSMQATVQAGRARLDKTRAATDSDEVFVTLGLGSWVMDKEDRVGQVVALYPHGIFGYQVGDTGYLSNDLSPELEYGDGVWTGDTVIDPDNEIGTVTRIFEGARNSWGGRDRAYRIQYKVGNGLYIAKGGLRREVPEYIKSDFPGLGQKVSPGTVIITSENESFRVEQVFSDGRVRFRVGAKSEVLTRNRYTVVPAGSGI